MMMIMRQKRRMRGIIDASSLSSSSSADGQFEPRSEPFSYK